VAGDDHLLRGVIEQRGADEVVLIVCGALGHEAQPFQSVLYARDVYVLVEELVEWGVVDCGVAGVVVIVVITIHLHVGVGVAAVFISGRRGLYKLSRCGFFLIRLFAPCPSQTPCFVYSFSRGRCAFLLVVRMEAGIAPCALWR
jgi:hypothetical protein